MLPIPALRQTTWEHTCGCEMEGLVALQCSLLDGSRRSRTEQTTGAEPSTVSKWKRNSILKTSNRGTNQRGGLFIPLTLFEVGPASQCHAVATLSPLPRPQSITSTSPRGNRCGSTRGTSTTGSCWRRSGRRWRPRRAAPRPRQVGAAMVPLLSAGGFLFGCHSILFVRAIFLTNSSFVPIAGQILALS